MCVVSHTHTKAVNHALFFKVYCVCCYFNIIHIAQNSSLPLFLKKQINSSSVNLKHCVVMCYSNIMHIAQVYSSIK